MVRNYGVHSKRILKARPVLGGFVVTFCLSGHFDLGPNAASLRPQNMRSNHRVAVTLDIFALRTRKNNRSSIESDVAGRMGRRQSSQTKRCAAIGE
ncbi:hypothetical protein SODALDRAFT_334842 [Sodiomyces alkalinus F11]|uniref:Uncharacterized protein n=1 Tax=Sodiomyces alkalinus (strain CBS 110278 / VKM F-3762 / F11) TaxID=1314773 RepID=A0A3N2PT67_SODAK|nr:hypothetical protein SODALDRAFT_334842 [Sodiomyces alkalinus F11]ROT37713.1 hypothetical protein SODALDRAFT_334842 [Sodiomyces alkalinus F11]